MIAPALALAAVSLGPVVLRGSTEPDPRPILRIDERGIDVQGAEGVVLIAWEDVKVVVGDEAERAAPFMPIADAAWRASARLARGDLDLAAPLFDELFERLRNVQSPTALFAAAGLASARIANNDLGGAIEPFLIASRLRDDGFVLDSTVAVLLRIDPETGLFVDLAPFFEPRSARLLLAGWPEDIEHPLAGLYRTAAQVAADPSAFDSSILSEDATGGAAFVLTIIRATGSPLSEVRTEARAALRAQIDAVSGTWREAWIRGAIGRSLLRESEPADRERGLIELLHVPARFSGVLPALAGSSLHIVLEDLHSRVDPTPAALEEQRRTLAAIRPGMALGPLPTVALNETRPASAGLKIVQQFADYLDAADLPVLLARYFEDQLAVAETPRRAGLAKRLAETYARLVESAEDDAVRAELEARAIALLAEVPDADTLDLRLRLARAAYTRAEDAAERWRLRLNSRADADTARRTFSDLESRFADLAAAAGRKVDSLERQEESSTGAGADRSLLSAALESTRRTRSMGRYLAGWSAYYVAELDPASSTDAVAQAERHFGWLLNARPGTAPEIDRVPDQLLSYEHVARSVIGVALAHSLRGSDEQALRWLALIESGANIPAPVAAQIPARKMIILARANRWSDIAALVDPRGRGAAGSTLSTTDARLLAVLALEASRAATPSEVQPLILHAVESLASRGELGQVLDLASRYFDRLQEFGNKGFLPSYIRGLRDFDRAARLHEKSGATEDDPATDPEARRGFESAADFLSESLAAEDASSFESALGGVSLVRAIARFRCAEDADALAQAATLFLEAAATLDQSDAVGAARARRLAIRAIDSAERASPTPSAALADRRKAITEEFLRRHPDHPAAAALLYERAVSGRRSAQEAAADLLSIGDDSPLAVVARHQAARLLYERMLAAAPSERAATAGEFLAVAEPLIVGPRLRPSGDEAEAVGRGVTTARRVVDAMLRLPGPDPKRVKRALDALSNLIAQGPPPAPVVRAEIEYRHIQLALLRDDWSEAESRSAALRQLDPSLFASAERAIFQRLADRWRSEPADGADRPALAGRVVGLGRSILHSVETFTDPVAASVASTTADAASERFKLDGEPEMGSLASDLYARLVAAYPRESRFLRAAADHAERAGDPVAALDARGRLLDGLAQGSPEWFDAKCRVIENLIATDPPRAKAAIDQHRILFPDLGPAPWSDRLRELEQRLAALLSAAPSGGSP